MGCVGNKEPYSSPIAVVVKHFDFAAERFGGSTSVYSPTEHAGWMLLLFVVVCCCLLWLLLLLLNSFDKTMLLGIGV
jgi:hypothetical protein